MAGNLQLSSDPLSNKSVLEGTGRSATLCFVIACLLPRNLKLLRKLAEDKKADSGAGVHSVSSVGDEVLVGTRCAQLLVLDISAVRPARHRVVGEVRQQIILCAVGITGRSLVHLFLGANYAICHFSCFQVADLTTEWRRLARLLQHKSSLN